LQLGLAAVASGDVEMNTNGKLHKQNVMTTRSKLRRLKLRRLKLRRLEMRANGNARASKDFEVSIAN
jgi:hypothetical protein